MRGRTTCCRGSAQRGDSLTLDSYRPRQPKCWLPHGSWSVTGYVDNLFDDYSESSVFDYAALQPDREPAPTCGTTGPTCWHRARSASGSGTRIREFGFICPRRSLLYRRFVDDEQTFAIINDQADPIRADVEDRYMTELTVTSPDQERKFIGAGQ